MTEPDIQKTTALLQQFKPGFLPYPVFEQIARLVALPIVEFIPLRVVGDSVEVLLIPRAADDPLFPSLLHTPGTVIRATDLHQGDQDDWKAFRRIINDELHGIAVGAPQYVGSMFHTSKRGAEQAQIYWIEVLADPKEGAFYPADQLPKGLMDSQTSFIRVAVDNFKRQL